MIKGFKNCNLSASDKLHYVDFSSFFYYFRQCALETSADGVQQGTPILLPHNPLDRQSPDRSHQALQGEKAMFMSFISYYE